MAGRGIVDQTLPQLRHLMMHKNIITSYEKKKLKTANRQRAFMNASDRKLDYNSTQKEKYQYLKSKGLCSKEADVMRKWSHERIEQYFKEHK
jgi:hypothetical protein